MGEYAKFNGEEIKIGTCNMMYYLRYDQKNLVEPIPGNIDPVKDIRSIWFRAPRADEENIMPGEFEYYGFCGSKPIRIYIKEHYKNFAEETKELCLKNPGLVQLSHKETGILINANCYHGHKGENAENVHYNGFNPNTLGIVGIGFRDGEANALIGCVACREIFARFTLNDLEKVAPFGDDVINFDYVIHQMLQMEREIA